MQTTASFISECLCVLLELGALQDNITALHQERVVYICGYWAASATKWMLKASVLLAY